MEIASLAEQRPAGVPEGATWLPEREVWETASTDRGGAKNGEVTQWRADGTLYLRGHYREGRMHGPCTFFHPSGQVAREGVYVDGEPEGLMIAYASDSPSPEVLRTCCVPEGAWQMKSRFDRGRLLSEIFCDRQGRVLLSDGSLRPERPSSVPLEADFDEYARRWMHGPVDERGSWIGVWRFWNTDGIVDEEAQYRDSRKVWSRLHDPDGSLRQELNFEGDSVRHGSYRRRLLPDEESPWSDPRIRQERGAFEHGQLVGPWTYLDAAGAVIRAVDYGRPCGDELEVFEDRLDLDGDGWMALARALRLEGRAREAACAAARAAARQGSKEAFLGLLGELIVPVNETTNQTLLATLSQGEVTVPKALEALIAGADPASVLRTLSSILKGHGRAALDFIDASILLAPERRMSYMTRSLVRIELGDLAGAYADTEVVAGESADAAAFLRNYVRVLFPAWTFWPAREVPESPLEDMPDAPGQPLPAVRRAIQLYATRLQVIRAELLRRLSPAPAWILPDLSALLPEGPLPLETRTAQIVDETDQGSETTEMTVDETLDPARLAVPSLMRLARASWSALCWLCWSAGLDEVALPAALSPPANFDKAAGMIISRYWRAQDGVITGGLRSVTHGVPGFVWEEMDLDGMPRHFVEMAHDEYLEMRAAMLFLASPENASPFQADLRQT
jgi:antitoxin component YwqK of YwqJK toxin-antitoxin module